MTFSLTAAAAYGLFAMFVVAGIASSRPKSAPRQQNPAKLPELWVLAGAFFLGGPHYVAWALNIGNGIEAGYTSPAYVLVTNTLYVLCAALLASGIAAFVFVHKAWATANHPMRVVHLGALSGVLWWTVGAIDTFDLVVQTGPSIGSALKIVLGIVSLVALAASRRFLSANKQRKQANTQRSR